MNSHHVTVHQLVSDNAFLNVDSGWGHVGVWGCLHKTPTYICRNGITFMFIQFDNTAWADEWIEENKAHWKSITRIESDDE